MRKPGAMCVLHTWGQNLSLHPHIHCIVPAVGITARGEIKHIGNQAKYLYPVRMLSTCFWVNSLNISNKTSKRKICSPFTNRLLIAVCHDLVVYGEPSLGNA